MNIKDVAKLCQTSVATISRVINNDPNVADATRKKVQDVIKETGFVPNSAGRNLRTQKSNKILVLLPTMANQFYSRIIQGVESRAEEFGYNIIIGITDLEVSKELKYLEMLKMKQVDGCISFFNTLPLESITEISEKYPFVQCCEPTIGADVSSVVVDNREAIFEVTSKFIEQGHKRIGMISGEYYRYSEQRRERGYHEALSLNNMKFDEKLVVKSFYRYKDGAKGVKELMENENPPTAIICVSDSLAVGVISYLKKIGKVVGKDVSVIGFDNTSITEYYSPTISSIAQPRFDLGQEAFNLLHEKLKSNESLNKKIILPHRVIHRESSGVNIK